MHPSPVDLARRYVELSNAHDLDSIFPLFAEDAVYVSGNVGEHRGRAAIEEMMTAFFAAHPDIRWEVAEYRPLGSDGAEFDFIARAAGAERRGHERILFDEGGLIRRVEVSRVAPA